MNNIKLLNRFVEDVAFLLGSRGDILLHGLFAPEPQPQGAEDQYMAKWRDALKPKMTVSGNVAHVPIEGVIAYNPDVIEMAFYGVEDSRNIMEMLQEARLNKDVKGVQLNIDSPGGFFNGGAEIADAVASLNKVKPVEAFIGGTGASLAYMIASQAGHITASRAARVGSIGAYSMNYDLSHRAHDSGIKVEVFTNKEATFKAMGIPGTVLQDVQREHIKAQTQAAFDEFKAQVLSTRPQIAADTMRGQVFTGKEGLKLGLVDAVGNRDSATLYLKGRIG